MTQSCVDTYALRTKVEELNPGLPATAYDDAVRQVDTAVEVPVSRVSSCTFGGRNLDTLFITTARWDMTPEELEANPQAGGLFLKALEDKIKPLGQPAGGRTLSGQAGFSGGGGFSVRRVIHASKTKNLSRGGPFAGD